MPRTSRPITVTLGDLQEHVEARVKSGAYASASEVIRAAVRALDREEAAVDGWLRQRVEEALADARPDVPAGKVFKRLRAHHAKNTDAATKGLLTLAELTPRQREQIVDAVESHRRTLAQTASDHRVSEKTVGAILESARVVASFQQSIDAHLSKGKPKAATDRKRATNRAPDSPLSPEIGKKEP